MSLQHKIVRTANAPTTPPDETETAVAQALLDLENSVPELKTELRALQISAAREIDVRGGKKAIVVFVPVPQMKAFHKVQARCVPYFRARTEVGRAGASRRRNPIQSSPAQHQAS